MFQNLNKAIEHRTFRCISVLWPPHVKSWLIGKDSDFGRDCGQEEKGTTEDEMAGWHHRLNGREFEWTPGVGDGQGGLACCDSWGRKESDTTERLNWTELKDTKLKDTPKFNRIITLGMDSLRAEGGALVYCAAFYIEGNTYMCRKSHLKILWNNFNI